MDPVLVTGGAGYVGAHACKVLKAAGFEPVTFDNLATGWREAVRFGPLEIGDLLDRGRVDEVFAARRPVAVMHFAALSLVGESAKDPGRYWRTNVNGSLNLVEAALAHDCRHVIFSSTCATYGDQDGVLLDEETPQRPVNAYGGSKKAIEEILANFGTAHGLNHMSFRYFNVAGADPEAEIGEQHEPETHLIPLILDAIEGKRPALTIFGTDYATPDGTCIRDYVHVMDLAEAHLLGLRRLLDGGQSGTYNIGSGRGFSVREVIDQAEAVTGRKVPCTDGPRRPGDAERLVSAGRRAEAELGWKPSRSSLQQMIADAWRWRNTPGFRA